MRSHISLLTILLFFYHHGFCVLISWRRDATRYALEARKTLWKMDGFVSVSLDTDGVGDLPVSVFIFGGKKRTSHGRGRRYRRR